MYSPIPAPIISPILRLVDQKLPEYRYVPGIFPHPSKHENGHSFQREEDWLWKPNLPWREDRGWLRGMDLFDYRYFWEAHEIWETAWKQSFGIEKLILQGMILASASLLQRHMNRERIAHNSWMKSKTLLLRVFHEQYNKGILLSEFIDDMDRELSLGGWPLIRNEEG
jgi:hypothetical protein